MKVKTLLEIQKDMNDKYKIFGINSNEVLFKVHSIELRDKYDKIVAGEIG